MIDAIVSGLLGWAFGRRKSAPAASVRPTTPQTVAGVPRLIAAPAARQKPSSLQVSAKAAQLIKSKEGLRLKAYQDTGGVWTIGYGHTRTARPGLVWTPEQALRAFREDVESHAAIVRRFVKVALTQNQFDALVSLAFNIGAGNFSRSTLLIKLNAGDVVGAAERFGDWVYDNGKRIAGLVTRRETEKRLFLS